MGKSIYALIILCVMVFVVGCNEDSIIEWQNSKEDAVKAGLKEEGADSKSILSIEDFEGETFMVYEYRGGLGVANIVKSEKGFGWNRSQPYYDFEVYGGGLPYSIAGYEIEMETGLIVYVLIGKTFDSSIREMQISGDGSVRKVKVNEKSGFFYAIHKLPFNKVDVSIVK
ncbi:MAG TPA: hypothetical protein VNR38_10630 [Ureibacillus sp.]|nr:hypothetical protein [Ureibacillus sp.]